MLDRNEKTSKSFDLKACKKDIENHRLHGVVFTLFFHPDYTVGTGISPVPAKCFAQLADFTADREFHPALKIYKLLRILLAFSPNVKVLRLYIRLLV